MSLNRAASGAASRGADPTVAILGALLAIAAAVLWGQDGRPTKFDHDQIAPPPTVVNIPGVQITTRVDSEGGGEFVYMQLPGAGGFLGPFLRLPSLPQGTLYGTTEVAAPSGPATPPCLRGQWARDADYLYMCLTEPAGPSASTGTRWRRVAFAAW